MSKSKEEQARREGMSYALRYAREHGGMFGAYTGN